MERLDKVWLILPRADAVDWCPGNVFETWQQAVAVLTEENGIPVEVKAISANQVLVTAIHEDDDEPYEVEIVTVPIAYRIGDNV